MPMPWPDRASHDRTGAGRGNPPRLSRGDIPAEAARHRADIAACRRLLGGGSRSFHLAARLLPRRVAEPAAALYAFCRLADDAIDLGHGRAARQAALLRLRERLDAAYAGRPASHPADRAFAEVVARHGIPRTLPEALIEGLAWDAAGRRYETLAELEAYAARVAGAVGAMMALLMGARGPAALARAADLGTAMQLTNIARDIGEDARAGRVYLPLSWLRAAGLDADAWLAAPTPCPEIATAAARLLDHAAALYARAEAGIALLPASCRLGIAAARLVYAGIGDRVARQGFDSVTHRAVVPARRKAWLLARAGLLAWRAAPAAEHPPLDANRFLVEAALAAAAPGTAPRLSPFDLAGRLAWLLDLFERLERRERGRQSLVDGAAGAMSGPV